MTKRRPKRTALRRRARAERDDAVSLEYRRDILRALERAGAPLTPHELASRLEIRARERRAFDVGLAALQRSGEIMQNRAGALLIARRIALIAGRVEGHPDGHGFLVPDEAGPSIYLPPHEMRSLMHGDRAAVRVTGTDTRGRPVGSLVDVLERAKRRIVGRLHDEHGVMVLVPEDRRIAHDIIVPDARKANAGEVVTVELLEPPAAHTQPVGRIAEVLGHYADPGMEIEIALRKFDLPHRFSRQALALAKALPDEVRDEDRRGRRDLRELEFVTIDGETAKDFDDAVYCEREGKGFRLWVAIADVSHYVRHGDALDIDARERGTSVYFPRRVIPMLPEKLSNGICSLNPNVDRLAVVCEVQVSAQGELGRYEFYSAVFRSHARLTYTKVWADISSGRPPAHLARLYELFKLLLASREKRGAIDFETVETRMIFDPKGKIERIVAEARNDAHRIIEECMLAANVCAGNFIAQHKQPVLYRVHDVPSEEKVSALRAFLAELGLQLPGGEIPKPGDYAALLEKIRGRPDFSLLQTVLLRSLKQAMYTPENVGHFGLAYEAYVHFTSPIRRYPDLLVHRAIKALLAGKRYDGGLDWQALGRHCSETERRADDASRDVESWLKCYYMREHVGETFGGTITGVVPFGLFVTLDDYFVDGLVHISELGRDYFQYDGARHLLYGERTKKRFRLADRMTVQLVRVDVDQRKIDLVPAATSR
ncbi:MAG TPA: ribonuclease R [Burkholderiales bacterium]|nr:ribonuclease R [Burkholderiales bacterium]